MKQYNPALTDEQKRVMFEKGTEAPGSGALLDETRDGMYRCANCGAELFASSMKYESKTPGLVGWPSFADAVHNTALVLAPDDSLGMLRTEVTCANCGAHLGHLFTGVDDHPSGNHYCINSCSLNFTTTP
ncbi:peptide-methionine (R)-S-oxide reductase MsrB [Candidatus Saccharibacteria bacterium]|nr:peptide-methionine (R)-S-oxide reductase MsrB [Candidatus Saccharibacteria bacterium]